MSLFDNTENMPFKCALTFPKRSHTEIKQPLRTVLEYAFV